MKTSSHLPTRSEKTTDTSKVRRVYEKPVLIALLTMDIHTGVTTKIAESTGGLVASGS